VLSVLGCLYRQGKADWAEYALFFTLVTWGIVMRRRERIARRTATTVVAGLGWCYAIASVLLGRRMDDDALFLLGLQSTSLTTVCVFLEIIFARRPDPVPRAIARERDS
jgi:hypothetical protein